MSSGAAIASVPLDSDEIAASPSFTPTQLTFFHTVTSLVAAATNGGSTDLVSLKQLVELCIHQRGDRSPADTVAVLHHALPAIASRLQSTHATKVKVWLLEFIEQLVRLDASQFIPHALAIVTSMTAEENLSVVKKVLSLGCSLFPLSYSWLSHHSHSWGVVHEDMHRTCEQLKDQLIGLWKGPSEAIKPAVIKFIEIVLLTLTNDKPNPTQTRTNSGKEELRPFSIRELSADHPVLTQASLKADVNSVLATLLTFAPSSATTFSALLKTFSTLCKQRSLLLSDRIVDRLSELVELILMEEAQLQLLPSEQQVARVRKDLQAGLIEVIKSQSFFLPNFDAQQALLMRGLASLNAEAQAQEVVRQQAAKRAEHVKQQGATYLKEITKVDTAQTSQQPTRPHPLPLPTLMHQLDELSRLPTEYVVDLVSRSLDQLVVPPSSAASYASADPSPVFLGFLQECLTASFNFTRAESALEQRQQFQHVGEIIRDHQVEAINTLFPLVAPTTPAPSAAATAIATPTIVRTVVPPIPVPELSVEEYESMSRSAFTRIASTRTAASVARSGESILRNVILAKLSTTNLLHTREYVHTVNTDLDPADPHASEWSSSLLKSGTTALPLRAYISGRLQDSDPDGYESVLNVLYSLLCVDTSSAVIHTQVKEKEAEEPQVEEAEEEVEHAFGEFDDDDEEHEETEKPAEQKDEDMKEEATPTSDAKSAGAKRKRDEPDAPSEADAAPGEDQPDTKRPKSEFDGADGLDSAATVVPSVVLAPSVLPSFAQHGTIEYGEVLDLLLEELREDSSAESRQHLYRQFLLDIPLLTPRVFASLDDWIYDPARSVIGLSALRDLILYRPPVRDTSLEVLLGYTHKPQLPQLRNQAIRLVVNQLYTPNAHLRKPILAHASRLLDALAEPDRLLEDLPEIVVSVIVPPVPVYDQIELPPRKEKAAAAATETGGDATSVKTEGGPTSAEADRRSRAEAADLKARQEVTNLIAEAERRKKRFDRLVFLRSLREKEKKLMEQQRDERVKRRVDRVVRHLDLYMSLSVHEPTMMRRIIEVYARCPSEFVRKCIHEQMPRLVRVLMRVAPDRLIQVLEEATIAADPTIDSSQAEPLVLHCLQLMTATTAPTASLVQSVTSMYQAKSSPRYLIPILSGLPVDAIRRYLPKLITLPVDDLRVAFQKLLHSKPPSSIKPSELLIALHLIPLEPRKRTAQTIADPVRIAKERKEDEDALDKRVIAATKLCFDDPVSYTSEVLGVVLSQLSDHAPLPKLLMRTVMQSMMLHSSLKSFIASNLLIKLINKHIYMQPVLWQGFLAAGNMLLPQSIPILIQLPDAAFMAMMTHPKYEKLQGQLVQFIQSFPLQVRRSIRELVQQMMQEKYLQQQMALMQQQQQAQRA